MLLCFAFYAEIQNGGKTILAKKLQMTLCIPCEFKFSQKSLAPFMRLMRFCVLYINQNWQGKQFLGKIADDCMYPASPKFYQNLSNSRTVSPR